MDKVKKIFGGDIRQFGMVIALVALIVFFQISTGGKVAHAEQRSEHHQRQLLHPRSSPSAWCSSSSPVTSTSRSAPSRRVVGIVVAIAMRDWGHPLVDRRPARARRSARSIGAWQGMWVAYVGIPGFIATLAGMLIFRGANQDVGKTNSRPGPDDIQKHGRRLPARVGPEHRLQQLDRCSSGSWCIAVVLWSAVPQRSRRPRKLGARGRGLPVDRVRARRAHLRRVIAYLTCCSARVVPGTSFPISGCILLVLVIALQLHRQPHRHRPARLRRRWQPPRGRALRREDQARQLPRHDEHVDPGGARRHRLHRPLDRLGPVDGTGWELDAIAAVFIGGAAVSGGVGTVVGSVIGGLVMAVLNNGLAAQGHRRRRNPDDQGPRPARSPSPSTSTTRSRAACRSSAC